MEKFWKRKGFVQAFIVLWVLVFGAIALYYQPGLRRVISILEKEQISTVYYTGMADTVQINYGQYLPEEKFDEFIQLLRKVRLEGRVSNKRRLSRRSFFTKSSQIISYREFVNYRVTTKEGKEYRLFFGGAYFGIDDRYYYIKNKAGVKNALEQLHLQTDSM